MWGLVSLFYHESSRVVEIRTLGWFCCHTIFSITFLQCSTQWQSVTILYYRNKKALSKIWKYGARSIHIQRELFSFFDCAKQSLKPGLVNHPPINIKQHFVKFQIISSKTFHKFFYIFEFNLILSITKLSSL